MRELDAQVEEWRAIGDAGVVLGFPRSLPDAYDVLLTVVAPQGPPPGPVKPGLAAGAGWP